MKKGLETLLAAVQKDAEGGNNCFNANGYDHEFYRTVPQDNPKLLAMDFKTKCTKVSKCFHKFCDKIKYVKERAEKYEELTGVPANKVIEIWENNRNYWYMSYYQEGKQPLYKSKQTESSLSNLQESIHTLSESLKSKQNAIKAIGDSTDETSQTLTEQCENLERSIAKLNSQLELVELENKLPIK